MPKKRLSVNKGLPKRWQFHHGAYYYRVPEGLEHLWDGKKKFKLGTTLAESYKIWAEKSESVKTIKNVGELIDRYCLEVIPTKALKTQRDNQYQAEIIRRVFSDMALHEIKPKHIYQYIDKREAKVAAKREIALLSHAYTKAVEWGYIDKHPFKGEIRLEGEKPRTRYVEDWEIIECLSLPTIRRKECVAIVQSYIKLKLITGLRRGDLLRLKTDDCREDGLHVHTQKTGKPIIYSWTDELRSVIEEVKEARHVDIAPYLFCNFRGEPYMKEDGTAHGWDSAWQRFMKRVMEQTLIKVKFTEHDLRAKCASDATSLEHARQLLAHTDSKITQKVYRRKPEIVMPLR